MEASQIDHHAGGLEQFQALDGHLHHVIAPAGVTLVVDPRFAERHRGALVLSLRLVEQDGVTGLDLVADRLTQDKDAAALQQPELLMPEMMRQMRVRPRPRLPEVLAGEDILPLAQLE